jgi:microcompartment protein CcmK/EutM
MTLGKVVGTVVATRKDEKLIGSKLLIVQETDLNGNPVSKYTVAVDAVGAGVGELVLTASGSSARQTSITKDKPVDAVIMAIVDSIEVHREIRFQK